jgi:hypothetical protein
LSYSTLNDVPLVTYNGVDNVAVFPENVAVAKSHHQVRNILALVAVQVQLLFNCDIKIFLFATILCHNACGTVDEELKAHQLSVALHNRVHS